MNMTYSEVTDTGVQINYHLPGPSRFAHPHLLAGVAAAEHHTCRIKFIGNLFNNNGTEEDTHARTDHIVEVILV